MWIESLHEAKALLADSNVHLEPKVAKILRAFLNLPLADAEKLEYLQLRLKKHAGEKHSEEDSARYIMLEHLALADSHQQAARLIGSDPPIPWVWSRGYAPWVWGKSPRVPDTYFQSTTETCASGALLREMAGVSGGRLWLRLGSNKSGLSDVATFAASALHCLRVPTVLISSDGDTAVPSELSAGAAQAILNHPNIIAWYTQNYDQTLQHEKLHGFPIGLDLHTGFSDPHKKLAQLHAARALAPIWQNRSTQILVDVANRSHPERDEVAHLCVAQSHLRLHNYPLPFPQAMQRYASHQFAVSCRGNGFDCHRTWELLMLNTAVIVRSGPLDGLYKGLPVIIIDDWRQLVDVTNLESWTQQCQALMQTDNASWLRPERFGKII